MSAARYMPYNRFIPIGRGALGEKANELMKEWLVFNPMPPMDWVDQIEAIASDARMAVPEELADAFDLYNSQLQQNGDMRIKGPFCRMNASLGLLQGILSDFMLFWFFHSNFLGG